MTLFSILIALFLEQVKPLPLRRFVFAPLMRYARFLEHRCNAGLHHHGRIAWGLAVLLPVLLLLSTSILLHWLLPLASFVLGVGVLYLTMGFRQFSHYFSDIQICLRSGKAAEARRLLAEWRGRSGERLTNAEVVRLAIEEALIASHHHVFAPLFWFVVAGPAGALLYRLALFFKQQWGEAKDDAELDTFGQFSRTAFAWIDWLPKRLSAVAFAIVGDFEDAIYCWRTQAQLWPDESTGMLLASGAGAMGVRLGLPLHDDLGDLGERPELGLGDEADTDFMQSTIGLVWRTLVLVVLALTLLWIGSWVGRV